MIFEHQSKNKKILFAIFAVILIVGVGFIVWTNVSNEPESIYCTLEAKQCPDGSYVGRTGPTCEFSPCPSANNSSWKTATSNGAIFQYPETLPTEYNHLIDWPPQLQVQDESFVCTEAGEETARAGKTEKRTVGDRTYCVAKVSEGAAGSIYTNYAYAFAKDGKTVIFTFSTQTVQCANYDEPQKTACENEQLSFDLDSVVDLMARTLQLAHATPEVGVSGVSGVVLLGPTCPVVTDPPDPNCADRPYAARLSLTTADQSRVVEEFSSGANGEFRLPVEPGEYAIRSAAAANILPYCSHDAFRVAANKFTDLIVSCDSGIR